MGRYKLSPEAKSDLRRIYNYGVDMHGNEEADAYFNAFFDRFDELAEQPYAYPAVDHIREGYRRSVCGVDTIYYRVDGEIVEIMAILGKQDPEIWL